MKTLILYASKHGGTRDIANRLTALFSDAHAHDLKAPGVPSLADYDLVIIGSSLYAGAIRKEARVYMESNVYSLRNKKLGLFLCGLDLEDSEQYFKENFPAALLETAAATAFLPGVYDPGKATFLDKLMLKIAKKDSGYIDMTDDAKVQAFADALKD